VRFCGNADFGLSSGVGIVSCLSFFSSYARNTTLLSLVAAAIVKLQISLIFSEKLCCMALERWLDIKTGQICPKIPSISTDQGKLIG
jgi:hypothetical protein